MTAFLGDSSLPMEGNSTSREDRGKQQTQLPRVSVEAEGGPQRGSVQSHCCRGSHRASRENAVATAYQRGVTLSFLLTTHGLFSTAKFFTDQKETKEKRTLFS